MKTFTQLTEEMDAINLEEEFKELEAIYENYFEECEDEIFSLQESLSSDDDFRAKVHKNAIAHSVATGRRPLRRQKYLRNHAVHTAKTDHGEHILKKRMEYHKAVSDHKSSGADRATHKAFKKQAKAQMKADIKTHRKATVKRIKEFRHKSLARRMVSKALGRPQQKHI